MLGWIVAAAAARVPMNGLLVGGSVAADVVWLEPTLAETPDYFRVGPDFGFELWGTSGKRKGGVRAGILFQGGFTPPGETANTSFRLGGGAGVGGIWGAKEGSYGTAHIGLGLGGYGVSAKERDLKYGTAMVWTRGELASGFRLGKHGALEIGPYAVLLPPLRLQDGPWKGDYWGHMGFELTLMGFAPSRGGGSSSPPPSAQPRPVAPDPRPGSDPTPPRPGSDPTPGKQPRGGPGSDSPPPKAGGPGSDSPPQGGRKGGKKGGKKSGQRDGGDNSAKRPPGA